MSQPFALRSPLSVVFLLHIALDVPMAVQGLLSPASLPFLQLNNTTLLYAALVAGICVAALLCYPLPDFLPGKRAFAMALCIYHVTCSTILFNAPRIVPMSFGALAESYKVTPEIVWGILHGCVGLAMAVWWQATVHYAQLAAARKTQ
ncbi:hypothetical protein BKA93DRAFT_740564 [Sparassis latifolia]